MQPGEDYYISLEDHRRRNLIFAVVLACCVLSVALVAYQVYLVAKPVDLSSDLSKVDDATAKKAAEQLTISIKNLPPTIDSTTQSSIKQNLAYLLRQKYGQSSTQLTASARQVGEWGENSYRLYIDIPQKHETYLVDINTDNDMFSITCAPTEKQMNASTHTCTNLPAVDNYNFPNG